MNPNLQVLIRNFDKAARPKSDNKENPATVEDMNNLVTQITFTLEQLVSELQKT